MKISLEEREIQNALTEYISNQGFPISDQKVSVTLIAGRGANGHSAQIDVSPMTKEDLAAKENGDAEGEEPAIEFGFNEDPD
jgi:hypothetical protein